MTDIYITGWNDPVDSLEVSIIFVSGAYVHLTLVDGSKYRLNPPYGRTAQQYYDQLSAQILEGNKNGLHDAEGLCLPGDAPT